MKAYTDLEQSKKLAEILPIESADMCWQYQKDRWVGESDYKEFPQFEHATDRRDIPCWSLAALLDVLPKICYPVKDHPTYLTLGKPKDKWCALYWDTTGMQDGEQTLADNPVDACVEMIIKLHDQKLL